MTKWSQLISPVRLGFEFRKYDEPEEIRTAFQRDYDRIIFSSPFRRLQNKTQVFPLPGSIFVHNRLTHSLEVAIFLKNMDQILQGEATPSLLKMLEGSSKEAMAEIKKISVSKIYKDPAVIQIEIAGYKILGTLLDEFTPAILDPKDPLSEKLLSIIPQQYHLRSEDLYEQLQTIVDFVSWMTDLYALNLYRKITGINLPGM